MKIIVKIGMICFFGAACRVQAIDIFAKTSQEIESDFIRPLSDIKNTISNTETILKDTVSPTDRLRVAGGFIKELSIAVEKLVALTDYLNNKFINSVLSKSVHNKVKDVIVESQAVLQLLHNIADQMREYRTEDGQKEPVLRPISLSKIPVSDIQHTE
jgi:hypothetical protein